jgi:hypothetical protein
VDGDHDLQNTKKHDLRVIKTYRIFYYYIDYGVAEMLLSKFISVLDLFINKQLTMSIPARIEAWTEYV